MNADKTTATLPTDRAFVVQVEGGSEFRGRIEHVTTGANLRFDGWAELQAFLEDVLNRRSTEAGHDE